MTVPRRCSCCGLLKLSVLFCFLFVFDFLFVLYRIDWWSSAGKELSSWLSACAVLLSAVLIVCVALPLVDWHRMWNSRVPVPDHCRFVYYDFGELILASSAHLYEYL